LNIFVTTSLNIQQWGNNKSHFSPIRTNKIHTFISWQIFHLQLSPPVAALDIKIDLAGQLTRQLVAVMHKVKDPVPNSHILSEEQH
jgi:hypothetical protein